MKKIIKFIVIILITLITFSISVAFDSSRNNVKHSSNGKSQLIQKAFNVDDVSDDELFRNGKRRCIRKGGTFYEYSSGSYACIYANSTSKLSNQNNSTSVNKSKKKDCFEKSGVWVTNSLGSFCYRQLSIAKNYGQFIKCENGMVVPEMLGCDIFTVVVTKKNGGGLEHEVSWGENARSISDPCSDPLNPGIGCDGIHPVAINPSYKICPGGKIIVKSDQKCPMKSLEKKLDVKDNDCDGGICERRGRNPQTGKEIKINIIKKQIEIIKNKIEDILIKKGISKDQIDKILKRKRPGRASFSNIVLKKSTPGDPVPGIDIVVNQDNGSSVNGGCDDSDPDCNGGIQEATDWNSTRSNKTSKTT